MNHQSKVELPNNMPTKLVESDLKDLLGPLTQCYSGWRVIGPTHSTARSLIYKAENAQYPKALCLKLSKRYHTPDRRLATEFACMEYYSDKFNNSPNFRTVRALAFVREYNCLVSEWENSPSLQQFLTSWWRLILPKAIQNERLNRIHQAGKWLKEFHVAGNMTEENFDPTRLVDNLNFQYRKIKNEDKELPSNTIFQDAYDFLLKKAENSQNQKTPYSRIHGDFAPRNLLTDGKKIAGIDITTQNRNACVMDVGRFLLEVQLTSHFKLLNEKSIFESTDGSAFLNGYGIEFNQETEEQIQYHYLYEALKQWISFSNKRYAIQKENSTYSKLRYTWLSYRCYQLEKIVNSLNCRSSVYI